MARTNEGGRLAYAELLRVVAMLAVIVLHVSGGWLESLPVGTTDWHALNMWDSLCRWCVPVFVMCSGMFLLDPQKALSWPSLFLRYILRMVTALLFWGAAYRLLYELAAGTLSPASLPRVLYAVILGNTETHLWYLTMTIGLYLLTPLLRAFVRGAKRSDFHWFFLVYALFMLVIPLFLRLRGSQTVALYANRLYLNFTLGFPPLAFVGYYLAGYYLKTYTLGRLAEGLIYVLGIAGGAFTVLGTSLLSRRAGALDVTLYSYLTPNVCAMAVAVFVLFRYVLGLSDERSRRQRAGRMRLRRLSLPCDLSGVAAPFWAGHAAHPHGGRRSPPHPGHLSPQLPALLAHPQNPCGGAISHLTQSPDKGAPPMLFSSSIFLFAFLPAVLLGYYVVFRGMRRAQNLLLLAASLFFYAWGEPWFVLVMMGSILANYCFGLWVHAWRRRGRRPALPVTAAVVCNLGLLFVFKYLTFTLENLNLAGLNTPVPVIGLPIGISFFTFQALSYVLDVAMGTAQVQRNPLWLGLYISLFPQLIAGPIVKYSTVADEIEGRRETWADFSSGCCRFIVGLGKKVLLSNQLAVVADAAWDTPIGDLSAALAWLGALCYTLQIYYDFSGYSDMAIGLGKLFGFHFLDNFNYPYLSRSVTEFWRRWHISLSTWFRDYVYIPLGGSRKGPWRTYRNLFVVWLLTGVWHGANWTFLCWGLFYFLLLCLEKLGASGRPIPAPAGWAWTFLMVNFGWVLFRAPSLPAALDYLGAMFSPVRGADLQACYYWEQYAAVILPSILFSFPLGRWLTEKVEVYLGRYAPHVFSLWDMVYGVSLLFLFLASSAFLVKGTYNPFIYFNF